MRARTEPRKRPKRQGAATRLRLFEAAYAANGGNGVAAARAAGYKGTPGSLAVTASRLLRRAHVSKEIAKKVDAVEEGMAVAEIVARLTRIGRMMDTQIDAFQFIRFLGPEVEGTADSLDEARAKVRAAGVPGPGWEIDLEGAKARGLGHQIRKVSHDPETGAPRLELESNLAVVAESRKALDALAKIRGLYRDAPPPPPRPDLTAEEALRLMPTEVLRVWNAAYKEALAKSRAINVEAKRIGG